MSGNSIEEHLPHLLTKLHPHDARAAGAAYEELRRRLILYFRLRRPHEAEDLTDTVFDRVARRLADGVDIESVGPYMVGVARLVLRERAAATQRQQRVRDEIEYVQQTLMPAGAAFTDSSSDAQVNALKDCLGGLEISDRSMILSYYGADGPARVATRQSLAQQLRISLNALHNRALRLRKQLERCVAARTPQLRGAHA